MILEDEDGPLEQPSRMRIAILEDEDHPHLYPYRLCLHSKQKQCVSQYRLSCLRKVDSAREVCVRARACVCARACACASQCACMRACHVFLVLLRVCVTVCQCMSVVYVSLYRIHIMNTFMHCKAQCVCASLWEGQGGPGRGEYHLRATHKSLGALPILAHKVPEQISNKAEGISGKLYTVAAPSLLPWMDGRMEGGREEEWIDGWREEVRERYAPWHSSNL